MRGHLVLTHAFREMARNPFGVAARVDEDERRSVLGDQLGEPVVHLGPDVAGHDGLEGGGGHLDGEIAVADMADIDDRAVRIAVGTDVPRADEKPRDFLDRLLGCGQADAREPAPGERFQTLQRQCQVRPALAADHRVNLIDDHGACRREHLSARLRAEQDVQGLGCRDDDVRRPLPHAVAFVLRCVARADERSDLDVRKIEQAQLCADPRKGSLEVEPDVVRKRLERGDVDHLGLIGKRTRDALAHQSVDCGHEGGEGLARAGRRRDEHVLLGLDCRPRLNLGRGGAVERPLEPFGDGRVESGLGTHTWVSADRCAGIGLRSGMGVFKTTEVFG